MTDETPTRPALADIREYSFSSPGEHTGYRVFPDELEQEPEVFFHGTDRRFLKSIVADGFLKSIVADGFRFPPPDKARSVSFFGKKKTFPRSFLLLLRRGGRCGRARVY